MAPRPRSASLASRADPLDCGLEPRLALVQRPGDVDRLGAQHRVLDLAQLLELGSVMIGCPSSTCWAWSGASSSRLPSRPDRRRQAHHDVLADRVDRGVRDLREALLEVGEQRGLLVGEHGEREVVAHRAGRLLRVAGDLRQQHPQVLLRIAEGELALDQRLRPRASRHLGLGQVVEAERRPCEPLAVGAWRATSISASRSSRMRPCSRSTRNRCPAWSRPRRTTWLGSALNVPASELSATQPSLGHRPAARAEAVAVEGGAEQAPVAEHDRGRAVPRLEQQRVEGVEVAQLERAAGGSRRPSGSSSSARGAARARPRQSSSSARSKAAESERLRWISGRQRSRSSPSSAQLSADSRARIQFMFPSTVLISPLWAIIRSGWASSQLGAVLVEKREWTIAKMLTSSGSRRSA